MTKCDFVLERWSEKEPVAKSANLGIAREAYEQHQRRIVYFQTVSAAFDLV